MFIFWTRLSLFTKTTFSWMSYSMLFWKLFICYFISFDKISIETNGINIIYISKSILVGGLYLFQLLKPIWCFFLLMYRCNFYSFRHLNGLIRSILLSLFLCLLYLLFTHFVSFFLSFSWLQKSILKVCLVGANFKSNLFSFNQWCLWQERWFVL